MPGVTSAGVISKGSPAASKPSSSSPTALRRVGPTLQVRNASGVPSARCRIGERGRSTAEERPPQDAPRRQREGPGNDKRAKKQSQHGLAVRDDVVLAGRVKAERQHGQRGSRQEMDEAKAPPLPQFVDKERAHRDEEHQADPGVADNPVRARSLEAGELHEAQEEGGERGEGMDLNGERGLEQRGERNRSTLQV